VKAGDGGAAAVAWRREKYVPRGGPAGATAATAASVALVVDQRNWRRCSITPATWREHRARNGRAAAAAATTRIGQNGPALRAAGPSRDSWSRTPPPARRAGRPREPRPRWDRGLAGRAGSQHELRHLHQPGARLRPEKGTPGEERDLVYELKLLADVGIIGFPTAGKSTLISRILARPAQDRRLPLSHPGSRKPGRGELGAASAASWWPTSPASSRGPTPGRGWGTSSCATWSGPACWCTSSTRWRRARGAARWLDHDAIKPGSCGLYSPELAEKAQVVALTKMDLTGVARRRGGALSAGLSRAASDDRRWWPSRR